MNRCALMLIAAAALSACTTTRDRDEGVVTGAVAQPFRDLNLVRVEPGAVLEAARAAPYGPTGSDACADAAAEIAALDEVLGPDADDPAVEKGEGVIGGLAAGAIKSALGLPFRGVVRKITGAEKNDRELALAVLSGMARRSYLKGLRAASGCS